MSCFDNTSYQINEIYLTRCKYCQLYCCFLTQMCDLLNGISGVTQRREGEGHWVLWIKLVLESTINIYHFRSMGHSMGLVRIALVGQHISSVNGQLSRWNNSGNCWKGSHSILTLVTKCWLVFGSRGQYCG